MHPHRLRRPDQRAQVLRVLQMIQNQKERRLSRTLGVGQTDVWGHIGVIVDFERYPLRVRLFAAQPVKEPPPQRPHRQTLLLGHRHDRSNGPLVGERRIFATALYPEPVETPPSGTQTFLDCVSPIQ